MHKSLVAIVGRPNVGKSTFFNKIAGKRISIVDDTPGVTRDRIYADVNWQGRDFTLIDTGGIDLKSEDIFMKQIYEQVKIAMETASVICFFVDGREGVTADDENIANLLRKTNKPIVLVVNKLDHLELEANLFEFYNLGIGNPVGISSANMLGLGDMLDEIVRLLPKTEKNETDYDRPIQIAVVGKPNVGKSSLVNKLLGYDRAMVSDIPGTTRDAIDSILKTDDGKLYNIIDTAGIRRKRSIQDESIERYSVIRSIAAISRCDVAILMIDALEGITEQDTKIAGIIEKEGKALIIAVNKWDMIKKETRTMENYKKEVLNSLKFVSFAPVIFISALTGQRLFSVLKHVDTVWEQYNKRISTGVLNEVLADATLSLQPPATSGRRLRIYYVTQQSIAPPTFVFFINDESLMHFSYARYLENQFRKAFSFEGTPLRFIYREKKKEE